jgi:transcriptional regulator with XRE-family HTH domain
MTLFELRKSMELKQRHTVSQRSIARLAGISRQAYSRYERGQSIPNILEASKLAMCYNVQLAEFVAIIRETVEQDARMLTTCTN